jgi:hypothetical protein
LEKIICYEKRKFSREAAAEAMRTRCKTCFKETSPNRICGAMAAVVEVIVIVARALIVLLKRKQGLVMKN